MKALYIVFLSLIISVISGCQQPSEPQSVSGKIGYLERIALAPNSRAVIRLYDVSIADKKADLIAEQVIELKQQLPVSFKLEFDPDKLKLNGRYSVRAVIESQTGKLLWTTDTAYLIDTNKNEQDLGMLRLVKVNAREQSSQGNPVKLSYACGDKTVEVSQLNNQIELVVNQTPYQLERILAASGERYQLEQAGMPNIEFWRKGEQAILKMADEKLNCRVMDTQASSHKLSNSGWQVSQINNLAVLDAAKVTINFSGQKIFGSAGCNQYTADYSLHTPEIRLSTIAVTKRACISAELAEQESRFLTLLGEVTQFKLNSERLVLEDAKGNRLVANKGVNH